MKRKLAAIVVPVSCRPEFDPDELISLRQLTHYLGAFDRYLIVPEGNPIRFEDFQVEYFNRQFFGSAKAHSQLMLSEGLYRRFEQYEYVLNYHPDALVFSDDLEAWCAQGWDYIGPPWIRSPETEWAHVERVGNGGFSLRKTDRFLQVLTSTRYWHPPEQYWSEICSKHKPWQRWLRMPKKYWKKLRRFNGVQAHVRHYLETARNEDWFWSVDAGRYLPGFRIPPVDVALRFAFEVDPRGCYERTNRQMPFGCHAWARYDRAFWEPHLVTEVVTR